MNTVNRAQTSSRLVLLMPVIALGISSVIGSGGGGDGGGTETYTIGGTVSGLSGSLVVQNNDGDDLSIDGNGEFTFNTAIANGTTYAVTIKTQPSAQTCYVTKGSGVVSALNVTDVVIDCFNSGSLDASFGSDGLVSWYGGYGDDSGNAITTDTSGRILVAGPVTNVNGADVNMTIWRYTADGNLDSGFGTDGIASYDTSSDFESNLPNGITLDADGRILVTGQRAVAIGGKPRMTIWRYTADGSLDTTFSTDGVVIYDSHFSRIVTGTALTLDADGRILVTGVDREFLGTDDHMVIWRYHPDGSLDTSFHNDGVVSYSNANKSVGGNAVTVDADGRILVAGWIANDSDEDLAIWRYLADGTPDVDFGTNGVVINNLGNDESAEDMVLDASGRILITGHTGGTMAIWRYLADGTPDIAIYNSNGTAGRGISLDASGRILVGGKSSEGMGIWRYAANGSPDTSFDSDGYAGWDDGYGRASGFDITTDASGRILVTGEIFNGSDTDMAIWRYHP